MFIQVTRIGGRQLRLAVAAIAYVDEAFGGSVVKLIGGEGLRVMEDVAAIEAGIDVLVQGDVLPGSAVNLQDAPDPDELPAEAEAPKPKGKRR